MKLFCQIAAATFLAVALPAGAEPETSCEPCHTEARPVHGNAALAPCTRVEPRGTHTADEGPDVITMSEGTGHYGRVIFSHKVHAEMAEMSGGCSACHHEATEGRPMRKCDECHSPVRARADLETPDLRGAIHRQCLACHEKWNPGEKCSACHADKSHMEPAPEAKEAEARGSLVLNKFHRDLACEKCHMDKRTAGKLEAACESCHEDFPKGFDHRKTGMALDEDHAAASCTDCHSDKTYAAPPTCTECHDDKTYPTDLPGERVPAPAPAEGASP